MRSILLRLWLGILVLGLGSGCQTQTLSSADSNPDLIAGDAEVGDGLDTEDDTGGDVSKDLPGDEAQAEPSAEPVVDTVEPPPVYDAGWGDAETETVDLQDEPDLPPVDPCLAKITTPMVPPDGPVSCEGIEADEDFLLCDDDVDHCAGIATGGRGCEEYCAAAGLSCAVAYQANLNTCGHGPITSCDTVAANVYCWCAPLTDPFEEHPELCNEGSQVIFDPYTYRSLTPFPSNLYSRVDSTSATCIRPWFPTDRVPADEANFSFQPASKAALEELDGYGTTAKIGFEVSKHLENGVLDFDAIMYISAEDTTKPDAPVLLIDIDPDSPEYGLPRPVLLTYYDDTRSDRGLLLLYPTRPLRAGTTYAAIVTGELETKDLSCLGPSTWLARLLTGTAFGPGFDRLQHEIEPLFALLAERGFEIEVPDVAGLTIFTTMDPRREMLMIAEEILAAAEAEPPEIVPGSLTWKEEAMPEIAWEVEGRFVSTTYRDWATGHFIKDETGRPMPLGTHEVEFRLHIPRTPGPVDGGEPYKIFAYHHGLGGDKYEGGGIGERLAGQDGGTPRGWATAYMSTIHHGERCFLDPTCVPPGCEACGDTFISVGELPAGIGIFHFFGIELDQSIVDITKTRDNFRQDYIDWLIFLKLLTNPAGLDVLPANAPDGVPDILDDKAGYTCLSLGGVMGGGIIALSPDVEIAFDQVGGGGVLDIILKGALFGSIVNTLAQTLFAGDGSAPSYELDRWFPLLQTLMDPGDPLNYAEGMFEEPFSSLGNEPKPVLFMMVENDLIVGNLANESLGRAAGAPQVGDPYHVVVGMEQGGGFPVAGNGPGGVTIGYNQFSHNCQEGDATQFAQVPFNHGDGLNKPVSVRQWRHFFESFYETGVAEIIDPYAPPLDCRYKPAL